ncbi:ATP-binding SpoIIE family protein phosphatase [Deinococcus yavapaiensis]|uniref:Anti-sigma regulatory factor (Ser/Thr protein kinase) n=1 Tax=Deinococcus yavapaiensis KR-236 TaxID=694435 RepID=A0A318S6H5_9DEIO|nr:ATP-binding SpoIIE family protein phosphatase [Deinococcus yavapaiensis]PYE53813.1 anti-sigma regulatory factor (Ser/Thr protein kinase) [Deinococcus yavapaiensis KR-236]
MRESLKCAVQEDSGVGEARRASVTLARILGMTEVRQGEVAIIVTELASNLVKHARGGELLVQPFELEGVTGLDVLALDRGPGVARPAEVLRDGYSTAGTPGTGLGAVRRLASVFDFHSVPDLGTAVLARMYTTPPQASSAFDFGVLLVAHPRERVCGDGVAISVRGGHLGALLVDGLGHGVGAHEAARAALDAFHAHAAAAPYDVLAAVHHGLRGTRGGVAGVARVQPSDGVVTFSGMGNVSATIVTAEGRRGLVSQNGTLGLTTPRVHEDTRPWTRDSTLVMHSDGLTSTWSLERYPGLLMKPATLIAGVLYRDFSRDRDDAGVLVVKEARA